jgi:hypothetical protein
MADRICVTSLIKSRITLRKERGNNGYRKTVFERSGLLDRCHERRMRNLLRPDTPK